MRAAVFWLLALVYQCWAGCPTDTFCEKEFDRCYKFLNEETDFFSAEDSCVNLGGHLVSIRNAFEGARVEETAKSMFAGLSDYWIGANHILTEQWSWTDGTAWGYTHWFPGGNTSNGAVYASLGSGLWSAASEGQSKPFVCSFPYVTENATTQCPVCPTLSVPTQCPACTTAAPKQCPRKALCEDGWVHFAGTKSCYKIFHNLVFASAEQTCVQNGGHLASIHGNAENNFVNDFASTGLSLNGYGMPWIGLHKVFDVWQWTDGTPVTYINWSVDSPSNTGGDESCVNLYSDYLDKNWPTPYYWRWNDVDCAATLRAAVCKKGEL